MNELGPYCNEDGDWWVPVAGVPFKKARELVLSCIQYDIPSEGALAYRGKETVWLDSEHEGYCGDECETNRNLLAYHFEEHQKDWM